MWYRQNMRSTPFFHLHMLPDFSFQVLADELLLATGYFRLESSTHDLLSGVQIARESGYQPVQFMLGAGQRNEISAQNNAIQIRLTIDQYPQWPNANILQWTLTNSSNAPLEITAMSMPVLRLDPGWADLAKGFWSFQGAAVQWGQDFAFAVNGNLERENYLGHIQNGEGGGIPLVYFWNQQAGLALAHIEPEQQNLWMPVRANDQHVQAEIAEFHPIMLQPGQSIHSPHVLLSLHSGDFFAPLDLYRQLLGAQGVKPGQPQPEDYAPAWCSWGYEFDVRPAEIIGVLPALKNLGIHWLTLDDRWFDCYGDWNPRSDTFPGGEVDMRGMVEQIHAAGGLAQIWWYPLCVEDGVGSWDDHAYSFSEVYRQHPDWLLLDVTGEVARNNRGLSILCPGLPEVQEYTLRLTRRFIQDWDFDGHKLDNIYTVPACHNPAHHHADPDESCAGFARIYRQLFELTRALKPHSVTQICPCGTPPTFSLIPAMSQAVTTDPTSSAQIRQRIKFYKALLGPQAAVFADHVELSDGGMDFASEIGVGGVPATKFVWPEDPSVRARLQEWWGLSPEKQALWKEWLDRYAAFPLAQGEYLNLYDLGFDHPEGHVIRLNGRMYYAFFTPNSTAVYSGPVEFRGLGPGVYQLFDYVRQQMLGQVQGPRAVIPVDFQGSLLVEGTEL